MNSTKQISSSNAPIRAKDHSETIERGFWTWRGWRQAGYTPYPVFVSSGLCITSLLLSKGKSSGSAGQVPANQMSINTAEGKELTSISKPRGWPSFAVNAPFAVLFAGCAWCHSQEDTDLAPSICTAWGLAYLVAAGPTILKTARPIPLLVLGCISACTAFSASAMSE